MKIKRQCKYLTKSISEVKTFFKVEKENRKIEKRKLIKDYKILSNKTLELEQKIKSLEENQNSLDFICSKLSKRSINLFTQVNELKEHEKKNLLVYLPKEM